MARETKQKTIGEHTYETEQLHMVDAKRVLLLLTKKLGPGLGKLLAAKLGGSVVSSNALSEGITQLVEGVDEKSIEALQETFGKASKVVFDDGRMPVMTIQFQNTHFYGGNMVEFFEWIAWCIEVNYQDFFNKLAQKPAE